MRAIFFSNHLQLPRIDGVDLNQLLVQLRVEHCHLPFAHPPPAHFCQAWRNQFYLFSIVKWMAQHAEGTSLVLDSDCLIRSSLASLFSLGEEKGYLGFLPLPADDVADDEPINNLSKQQLGDICAELIEDWPRGKPAPYYQGEFLLLSASRARQVADEFELAWTWARKRHQQGLPHFQEEAHALSYLFCKLGFSNHTSASRFIRRIWTDANYARNVDLKNDRKLAIWHLPAEKKFGFRKLYALWRKNPALFAMPEQQFQALIEVILNLRPRLSSLLYRKLRYLVKRLLVSFHLWHSQGGASRHHEITHAVIDGASAEGQTQQDE